ncbi:E3 ubiquitin-protein ligase TRIM39-like [Xyrauchen texanus]|uniref:E3 ubiquitin-protein ligase TRIM39-like n=1 Tax=Xyrauchen texanus TaxID=154827 RepID=UPI00224280E6|nr:E3 ubiquitin-protein ligase TRIM39-like [Xyrauchen texanus]
MAAECPHTEKDLVCPVCLSSSRPPINLDLKIAADVFKKKAKQIRVKSVDRCSMHNEELNLFCRKDAELICAVCTSSRSHANHEYCPITEAASEILKELTTRYNPLKRHLNSFEKLKESLEEMEAYIQTQAAETAEEIKKEFEKLHAFLREEESARLKVLQNERDNMTEALKERMKEVNKKIEELSDIIDYIEPIIMADDLSFLKTESTSNALQD